MEITRSTIQIKQPNKYSYQNILDRIEYSREHSLEPINLIDLLIQAIKHPLFKYKSFFRESNDNFLPAMRKPKFEDLEVSEQIIKKIDDFNKEFKRILTEMRVNNDERISYSKNMSIIRKFSKTKERTPAEIFKDIIEKYNDKNYVVSEKFFNADVFIDSPLLLKSKHHLENYFEIKALVRGLNGLKIDKFQYFLTSLKTELMKRNKEMRDQCNLKDKLFMERYVEKFNNNEKEKTIKMQRDIKNFGRFVREFNYPGPKDENHKKRKRFSISKKGDELRNKFISSFNSKSMADIHSTQNLRYKKLEPLEPIKKKEEKKEEKKVTKKEDEKPPTFLSPFKAAIGSFGFIKDKKKFMSGLYRRFKKKTISYDFDHKENVYKALKDFKLNSKAENAQYKEIFKTYYKGKEHVFEEGKTQTHLFNLYGNLKKKLNETGTGTYNQIKKIYGEDGEAIPNTTMNILNNSNELNGSLSCLCQSFCREYVRNQYLSKFYEKDD